LNTEPRPSPTELQRIGVFGGAFDPPHNAHVALAQAALAQLDLRELHVIPTGIAWHKTRALTPPNHRLAMAHLAFGKMPRVIIDPRELERAGPTYTIDTLEALRRENPLAQLHLIMGADQFAAFRQWHRWEAILDIAIICVAERATSARASGLFESFLAEYGRSNRFKSVQMAASPISATRVRQVVLEGHPDRSNPLDIYQLVPPAVARYISDHALYQAGQPD
jgi:nicotinate-nucleotide adenylyltransferase